MQKKLSLSVILILLAFMVGCQKDEIAPIEQETSTKRLIITASDIPEVKQTLLSKIGATSESALFSANHGETANPLKINWEKVMQVIDSTGKETYAFGLQDLDDDPATFYNLILQYNADHEAYAPYILRYRMAEDFIQEYYETRSLADFRGSIQKININPPSTGNLTGSAALGRAEGTLTIGEPCPDETVIGGGGDSGSGGGATIEVCTTHIVYTEYVNALPGGGPYDVEIVQIATTVTECEWVTMNSSSDNNDNSCAPDEGEIPIVEPDDQLTPFICNKNIQFKTVGNAQTAQISGLGLSAFRFGMLRVKFVELGIVCVTVPGPNSTAATVMFITAYNKAVTEFGIKLNAGNYGRNPLTSTLKIKFKDLISAELRLLAGSAASTVRFSSGPCFGGVPNTAAKYCKSDD